MYLISDGGSSCNSPFTLEAIMLTKNIDYIDGIKLNLYQSRDNVIVVCEDNDLSKFTLSNNYVSEMDYKDIKKVKFPSHIFKYYIPTLEEILKKYNNKKKIVLEIKFFNDNYDDLANLLEKYVYQYYFLVNDEIKDKVINSKLNNLGTILNNYLITDNNDDIDINNNYFVISKYPEKIYHSLINRQNM